MFDVFKTTPFPSSNAIQASSALSGTLRNYGAAPYQAGLQDLLTLLQGQGSIDPRLLAAAQAQNARSTQGQQDAINAQMTRQGLQNSGLAAALRASTAAAGANRGQALNYQNLSDAYQRRQQNLSLLDQLAVQPALGWGSIGTQWGLGQQAQQNQQKSGWLGFAGSLLGGAGKIFGL